MVCEVFGERAADTAVGHRNEAFIHGGDRARARDEIGINVDLADVVNDDRSTDALRVGEDVVEQGGLACTEVAGDHCNLDLLLRHGVAFLERM